MDVFSFPLALLALPLPLLALLLLPPMPARSGALKVPAFLAARLSGDGTLAARNERLHRIFLIIAWASLVIAVAGPQRPTPITALPASGREIMLVIDLSGSMERKDFMLDGQPVRRLEAVKKVGREFLQRRAGDRIGVVFFAEQADVVSVPTFDIQAVDEALAEAEIGLLGRSTGIGDGLGLAVKRLKDTTAQSKIVVLLSDGTSTAGAVGPMAAADLARQLGIKVHTIALGTDETLAGSDGAGSLVDTQTLADIAKMAGGEAFRVRTTEDLEAVADSIDRMEGGEAEAPPVNIAEPLWPYPAMLAFLALCALFWTERRRA